MVLFGPALRGLSTVTEPCRRSAGNAAWNEASHHGNDDGITVAAVVGGRSVPALRDSPDAPGRVRGFRRSRDYPRYPAVFGAGERAIHPPSPEAGLSPDGQPQIRSHRLPA